MSLTLTNPTLGPGVVDADELNDNFSDIASKFGNIDNSDIKSGAGISIDKLSASYEYMVVPIAFKETGGTGLTASRFLGSAPLYNDGKGTWTAVAYGWQTNDVGAMTGAIDYLWGYYETTGSLNGSPTVIKNAEALDGGTANLAFNDGGTVNVTLPWTVDRMMIYVVVDTADATACSTAGDWLYATVTLKRQIKT